MSERIEAHVWVGLDGDGHPIRAFEDADHAREARDSDNVHNEEIEMLWPDVPLVAEEVEIA